jgi:hypothetical protein
MTAVPSDATPLYALPPGSDAVAAHTSTGGWSLTTPLPPSMLSSTPFTSTAASPAPPSCPRPSAQHNTPRCVRSAQRLGVKVAEAEARHSTTARWFDTHSRAHHNPKHRSKRRCCSRAGTLAAHGIIPDDVADDAETEDTLDSRTASTGQRALGPHRLAATSTGCPRTMLTRVLHRPLNIGMCSGLRLAGGNLRAQRRALHTLHTRLHA